MKDETSRFICNVTDLELHGANFPDDPLFVERDSLGYLWFFSDVSAYRYDGASYQTISFEQVFNTPIRFEFLRSVVTLPNGHFACHFAHEQARPPSQDTLCAFDPIHLRPTAAADLPRLRPGERLITVQRAQGNERESIWHIENERSRARRMAMASPTADTLISLFEIPRGFSCTLLHSTRNTGSFFIVLGPADSDSLATVHCRDGRCTRIWDNHEYTRGFLPIRRFKNNNLWFDASGEFLARVHRVEDKPRFQGHEWWIHRQDGSMIPDTAGTDRTDWSSLLHLDKGLRASEFAFDAASQQVWCFSGTELKVFHRDGTLRARVELPVPESFTKGILNSTFLNSRELVVVSKSGLLHLSIDRNPFAYLSPESTQAQHILGSRSMLSWNRDTVLVATDAGGIYSIQRGQISRVINDVGLFSGLHAEGGRLVFMKNDSLIETRGLQLAGATKIADLPTNLSWALAKDDRDRWIIGHQGLAIVEDGAVTLEFNDQIQNAYHITTWRDHHLIAANSGLWGLRGDTLVRLSDRFPELEAVTSPCHATLLASDGIVWICTKGEGLVRWDAKRHEVEKLGVLQGLPSEVVYGALEADDGAIWASTNLGLIRLTPDDLEVQVFGVRHGLAETEFNRTSFLKHLDGQLLFGAITGVVAFDPLASSFSHPPPPAPFVVDRILQHNQSEHAVNDVTGAFRRDRQVSLGPSDDFVSIRPRVLDFSGSLQKFAYRLREEGAEPTQEWTLLEEDQIQLTNIPHGRWIVDIRARGLESGWHPETLSFPITVRIPFYLQPGYPLAGIAVLFGLIFGGYSLHNKNLKRRNDLLESRIDERTKKLRQAVALKDAYLAETHHRVKNNLQIISSLLDLQADQIQDDSHREQFNISKTRIDSIALIHQRLYDKPDTQSIDFKSFLIEMMRLIERSQLRQTEGVALRILGDDLRIRHRDGVPLGMIFNELFTNTIKHVVPHQADTSVEIVIRELPEGQIQLTYNDHGPGLPPDSVFEEMESLGLRLVGRFIHQLGGTAVVDPTEPSRIIIAFTQRNEPR